MTEHVHRGPSYKDYSMVFVGLILLTLGTVAISYTSVGEGVKTLLAFTIATIKTLLVASIFMHLRFEPRTILIFAVTPVFLAILFIVAIAPDIGK
jgi:caa(3)-type oxidase subunit IV